MTDRTDVARGRDIVARWCGLAEQRLDYLTELFETGRWRRYHSEAAFLENIREAKGAVETWRGLLTAEATTDNLPVDLSWIGRRSSVPQVTREVPSEPIIDLAPQVADIPIAPEFATEPAPSMAFEAGEVRPEFSSETAGTEAESALERTLALTLDIVGMAGRYPSLRNAFQQTGKG